MEIIVFRLLENYSANSIWVGFSRSEALTLSLNQNFDQNYLKIDFLKDACIFCQLKCR